MKSSEGGMMCRLLLSACLLLCLPACRLCQHRSLFIVRSLAVLTLMPAADPIPSVAPPPISLSLSLLLSFSVCLGLAWLGSARIQSLLPWATIEIMDFMCHKLLLMQQSNIYDDNSR